MQQMLTGAALGAWQASMNPVAVFLGLLFWGWLWGVVGLSPSCWASEAPPARRLILTS